MSDKKRTKSIKIRVNDSEFLALNKLKDNAGFSMLADYMRTVSLNLDIPSKNVYPTVDPALHRLISGIGNNVNQVARKVNSSKLKACDSIKIICILSSIDENLKRIRVSWSAK
ncbi:plasmid mobilization protein [Pseudoalteromonas sp. ZZD1]|uniref:plasmid mobilization protein n=1 Tax=Pseudoalteromonas sp. ZZD1 TaxID=3139395 RepID=UPI003BABBC43